MQQLNLEHVPSDLNGKETFYRWPTLLNPGQLNGLNIRPNTFVYIWSNFSVQVLGQKMSRRGVILESLVLKDFSVLGSRHVNPSEIKLI